MEVGNKLVPLNELSEKFLPLPFYDLVSQFDCLNDKCQLQSLNQMDMFLI